MAKIHSDGRVSDAGQDVTPEDVTPEDVTPEAPAAPTVAGELTFGGELDVEPAADKSADKSDDKPRTMSTRKRKSE